LPCATFSTEKDTAFAHVSVKSTGTRSLGIPAFALRIKSTSPLGTDSSDTQTSP
jgi:hypothetical protein